MKQKARKEYGSRKKPSLNSKFAGTLSCILFLLIFMAGKNLKAGCSCFFQSACVNTNYNKVGFVELCDNISVPPKLYLQLTYKQTLNKDRTLSTTTDSNEDVGTSRFVHIDSYDINAPSYNASAAECSRWSLAQHYVETFDNTGSYSFTTLTTSGVESWDFHSKNVDGTNTYKWSLFASAGDPQQQSGTNVTSSSYFSPFTTVEEYFSGSDHTYTVSKYICTNTLNFEENDLGLSLPTYGPEWTENGTYEEEHSVQTEYTDMMLRGKIIELLPPLPSDYPIVGPSPAFFKIDGANHECGHGQKMHYRLKIPDTVKKTTYTVLWHEQTVFDNGTTNSVPIREDVTGTGGDAFGKDHFVDVPTVLCQKDEVNPDIIAQHDSSSGGPNPGSGGLH